MSSIKNSDSLPFKVCEFSDENLLNLFNYGSYPIDKLKANNLFKYLHNFLRYNKDGGHFALAMVVEKKYLSESYLKDYVNYYAESFNSYSKFTRRIHFFNVQIKDELDFRDLILNNRLGGKELKSSIEDIYLGYVVIKPTINSFIGATFLKPYSGLDGLRNYNSVFSSTINLFGRFIKMEGCVFQQQDRAVSACATSALWSAFHVSHQLFGTPTASPSEITISAGLSDIGNRTFPNKDLDNLQIAKAIVNIGLVPELRIQENDDSSIDTVNITNINLRRIVYAYNRIGIPILLGYKLKDSGAYHLITLIGYRMLDQTELKDKIVSNESQTDLKLVADNVKRFYAHNDQIGPYVKVNMKGEGYDLEVCNIDEEFREATTDSVIIPIIENIRISYENIAVSIFEISSIVDSLIKFYNDINEMTSSDNGEVSIHNPLTNPQNQLEWDIYLEHSNQYKSDILNDKSIHEELRIKISETSFPKYIWLCRCQLRNEKDNVITSLFDMIYDPTDVPTGFCCFQANFFNIQFGKNFLEFLKVTFGFSEDGSQDDSNESKDTELEVSFNFSFNDEIEFTISGEFEDYEVDEYEVLNKGHITFFEAALQNTEGNYLDRLRKFKE